MQGQTHTWPKYIHPVVRNFFSVRSGVEEFPLFGKLRAWRDDGKRSSAGSCWHRSFGGGGLGGGGRPEFQICRSVLAQKWAIVGSEEAKKTPQIPAKMALSSI